MKKHVKYRPLLAGADLSICTDSEKLDLLSKVRKNDRAAIDKMILCHIRLAISIVGRFVSINNFNHYINDLDSAAMEAVTVAVNQVAAGKMTNHDNITGYIIIYVNQFITAAAARSLAVYTPRNRKIRNFKSLYLEIPDKDSQLCSQEFELWDTIESLINNDIEKEILKLRRDGRTDLEIAELTGLSRLRVLRIRRSLSQRYQRKVKNVRN